MAKILLIEDDQQLTSMYRKKLTHEGYDVVIAATAKEGLSFLQSENVDLVILDIMLPGGLNGFDVLETMKKDNAYSKIPVLILTNLDSEEKVAKEIGVTDYLVKANTTPTQLVERIQKILH